MANKKMECLFNEEGSFSIWFTMLAFIMVMVISASLGGFQKLRAINEIQGVIDVAGVSALRAGVDENAWRDETLVIDQSIVYNTFKKLIDIENLKSTTQAKDITMQQKIVTEKSSNFTDKKERQEVYLVTDTYMTFEHIQFLDNVVMTTLTYYDFFDNKEAQITFSGTAKDGTKEVLVRSISRLTLR